MAKEGSGKFQSDHESTMPKSQWYPGLNDYGHYRLGLMMAKHKHEGDGDSDKSTNGPIGNHPMSVAYSNVDLDIVNRARKLCGYPEATLSASDSREPDHVHKVSPTNTTPHRHPRRPWESKNKK